ncbi:methyltransferase [Novosphingobium sp.]|uniref:class I SAM-dependent methyltransferase n=1 Tax=Novosphingobium sp. TaxID=1874826 RepID=UPI0025F400D6|nr:methyltransferase [Novosphingobium sp.]
MKPVRLAALIVLASASLLSAPPLLAKPSDYAAAVADKARGEKNRALDVSRMPAEVLDFAGVTKGQTVVDYFTGSGYWAEMFSRAVGPRGVVYAADPPSFADAKAWEPILASHANVRMLLAPIAQMKFAPRSADLLFINLNYHDLYWESEKYKYPRVEVAGVLADWFTAVKPGGSVVIIDHAGPAGDTRALVEKLHRIDPAQVKADMAAAGFVLDRESDLLRRTTDNHETNVFDPSVRGKTDRFMLKFRRP